jgi:hypothetical protein
MPGGPPCARCTASLARNQRSLYEQGPMDAPPGPSVRPVAKKASDILVLRCLNPECGGLLAYEVDRDNVLYVDLAWTARTAGSTRYFPCPKCGGKNMLEEFRNDTGQVKHKVVRWEP